MEFRKRREKVRNTVYGVEGVIKEEEKNAEE